MPNRILREGINSSARVNAMSFGAQLLYRRLISVVDDYGRFHAAPATVLGACWPTCPDRVTAGQVKEWLGECETGPRPLVKTYYVEGCMYLEITEFKQQVRTKSKFPDPCQQSDINLKADCAQDVSTSRSSYFGIRISEAEAGAATAADLPQTQTENTNPIPPTVIRGDDAFERMYTRHPRKKDRGLAQTNLAQTAAAGASLVEIDRVHALYCEREWINGEDRFAPTLAQWLLDKGWLYEPKARDPTIPNNSKSAQVRQQIINAVNPRLKPNVAPSQNLP